MSKIAQFFKPQTDTYMSNYTKRIKLFMWISVTFLTYSFVGMVFAIMGRSLIWDDDIVLTIYLSYLSLFTGYNYWRLHQNSVYEEKKNEHVLKNPLFIEWARVNKFEPFDHKKARKQSFRISSFAIGLNVVLIILNIMLDNF